MWNHRYYIVNCGSWHDVNRAAAFVRQCGGEVRSRMWDGNIGGVAYVSFDVDKENEVSVIKLLGEENCY
jgi:hypothetical protein